MKGLIKGFMIHSGRYVLKLAILLPLFWSLLFGAGTATGYFVGNNFGSDTSKSAEATGENGSEATGEKSNDREADIIFILFMCVIGGMTPLTSLGVTSNAMYNTDGSKYFRTVKNGSRRFLSAVKAASVLAPIAAIVPIILLYLMQKYLLGFDTALYHAVSGLVAAVLSVGGTYIAMLIKNKTVRIIELGALFACMFGIALTVGLLGITGLAICAVIVVIFTAAAYVVFRLNFEKNWLFDSEKCSS